MTILCFNDLALVIDPIYFEIFHFLPYEVPYLILGNFSADVFYNSKRGFHSSRWKVPCDIGPSQLGVRLNNLFIGLKFLDLYD